MLIYKLLGIWVLERAIEIALGSYMLLIVFGTNASSSYSGTAGDLYINAIYILFFYIASGFIVSAILFGLWRRSTAPFVQSAVLTGCFLVHMLLFMLIGRMDLEDLAPLVLFGAGVIALSNFAGSLLLSRMIRE